MDNGQELFGDSTPFLGGGRAQNGYQALFELDVVHGNGNGWIDRSDKAFEMIGLWADSNHDGISQPEEMQTLVDAGVVAISTEYFSGLYFDPHGNAMMFTSEALVLDEFGEVTDTKTVDVFFTADD
ncbi:MAG: hypothetical protein AAF481_14720 [Acidobacteriota bacterium]